MTEKLTGRRVLLTGVSRGVGFETAKLFLSEGASVLGVARDPERLAAANRELERIAPGRYHSLSVDLSSEGFEEKIKEAVLAQWDGLDVLFNNAGVQIGGDGGISEESTERLEKTMNVNLWVPLHLTRALLPLLLKGREPRVVHLTSGAGTLDGLWEPNIAAYRLSKWALNGLTVLQAAELKGKVAVNALDPGWVKTDLGGPKAPGHPRESAVAALQMMALPFEATGKLYKDGNVIPF